jgi:hypothetical protein
VWPMTSQQEEIRHRRLHAQWIERDGRTRVPWSGAGSQICNTRKCKTHKRDRRLNSSINTKRLLHPEGQAFRINRVMMAH